MTGYTTHGLNMGFMGLHTSIFEFWGRKVIRINPHPETIKRLDDGWNPGFQTQPSGFQLHDPMILQTNNTLSRLEGNRIDVVKGVDA